MQPYGTLSKAFAEYTWDALCLQPFRWAYDQNIRDIPLVLEKFYQKSPDGDVFIYAQWPAADKGGDWTRRWLEPRSSNIMSRQEYEDHVTWLRANNPGKKPARLVPVGHVMHLLDQRAKAGLIPGLETMWDWYIDGVHVNNAVNFIVAPPSMRSPTRKARLVCPLKCITTRTVGLLSLPSWRNPSSRLFGKSSPPIR